MYFLNRYICIIFMIVFMFTFTQATYAGWFGPGDYDECILDRMKGVASDVAAREIRHACRSKFPRKPATLESLGLYMIDLGEKVPEHELKNITGNAGPDVSTVGTLSLPNGTNSLFKGTIENNIKSWRLMWLEIQLVPVNVSDGSVETQKCKTPSGNGLGRTVNGVFRQGIEPLTKGKFFCSIYAKKGLEFEWSIVGAKGFPVK